ncbi:MAG: PRC-barrel domain-containing protein [Ferrovibrio sp.]|uniref:PRC-barrel domain-containing protein n=1 Tax=Ferrovibrio sp. TaxID=1917215 RepID=UPI00261293FF|nr:PRC-barrel domain-containing protein [Ferrovibrio sp.]MCW0233876.1 PRC-barrel domain-containing protein [Ferrovibrio sp.]
MRARYLAITTAIAGLALSGTALAADDMKKQDANPATTQSSPTVPGPNTAATPGSAATGSQNGQNGTSAGTSAGTTTGTTTTGPATSMTASVDAKELLGSDLKNANGETIGEVESVYVDKDGKVQSVIVGVGGFLGLGERNVSVGWNALTVADGGDSVRTTLTKDQLKAMPEYQYSDKSFRGKLFSDSGVWTN